MEIVWDAGEATVSDVRKVLASRQRDLARNTVLTMMVRMEEKGWLKHRESGNTFVCRPTLPRNVSRAQKVGDLDSLFGGRLMNLAPHCSSIVD